MPEDTKCAPTSTYCSLSELLKKSADELGVPEKTLV